MEIHSLRKTIFTLLNLILNIAVGLELPRGVPLSRASFYQVGVPFTCLDGSATISWMKVNDDYCDCRDGSDEPGTSACSNGAFHCRDMQYRSVFLPSAYVNDGICDCCDGSDEYENLVSCSSVCGALAASLREAKSIKRAQIEQGHKIFKEYVEKLKERKEQKIDEETAVTEETIHKDDSPSSQVEQEHKPIDHDHDYDTDRNLESGTGHETNASPSESSDMPANNQVPDVDREELTVGSRGIAEGEHDAVPVVERTPVVPQVIDFGPENGFQMLTELPQGCLEIEDREYTYKLCPFKAVYQRPRGTSGELDGTSIGTWDRWLEMDGFMVKTPYDVMYYGNGAHCWNGPSRSTKVFVHCGHENRLTSVEEPSRCEYIMQLVTPAACYEDPSELFRRLHPESDG